MTRLVHPSIPLLEESKDQPQSLEEQASANDEDEHVCSIQMSLVSFPFLNHLFSPER
jgi:hypothetical protein